MSAFCAFLTACQPEVTSVSPDVETLALMGEANQHLGAGNYGMAVFLADSAINRSPNSAETHFLRATIYSQLNQYPESNASLDRVLALDPTYASAWFQRGNNAFVQRAFEAAKGHYEKEIEVLERKRDREGVAFAEMYPLAARAAWLQLSRTHTKLGETVEAEAALRSAIQADSTHSEAWSDLSHLAESDGRLEEALVYATKAHQYNPEGFDQLYTLGSLLLKNGEAEKAIPYLGSAVNLQPWYAGALYDLGRAYTLTGEEDTATRYLTIADSMQALSQRIDQAHLTAQQYPDVPERWMDVTRLLLQAGRLDDAMETMGITLSIEPNNLAVQNDMANLMMVKGDTTGAILRYESLLARSPDFVDGWINLGVMHAMRGDFSKAQGAWQEALRLDPGNRDATAYLNQLNSSS